MPAVAPGGTGSLLVRLIVSGVPAGTVMTTGDQLVAAFGLVAAQVAVLPLTTAPQV
jgi:hypothetical protein